MALGNEVIASIEMAESMKPPKYTPCIDCGAMRIITRRILEGGAKTHNYSMACVNQRCIWFEDVSKTPSWVRI